jgi:hypothetical protein
MTAVLRDNHGVITLSQLNALGISARTIDGFLEHGDLRRLHSGVYADGRTRLTDHGHMHAALLAAGTDSWLAGRTAAAAWGLDVLSLPRLEVAVVGARSSRHRELRGRRVVEPPHQSEIRTVHGLRVSSVPRLLIEAAADGADVEVIWRLVEAAARRRLLDVDALHATLERHAGGRGVRRVRLACEAYLPSPGRKSTFEQAFDRWLLKHPEIPQPVRNAYLGPWEIDCYWPSERVAVELDARDYHVAAGDFERDRRKDAWLQRNEIRILRVSGEQWDTDQLGVHDNLTALLALGRRAA